MKRFVTILILGCSFAVHAEKGGKIISKAGEVEIREGQEALLLYSAATDFNPSNPSSPLKDWEEKADKLLSRSRKTDWKILKDEAAEEMRGFMARCTIDLGATAPELARMPTAKRLEAYRVDERDPELEALLFQFGRYLLVGSNRPGGLPANLQGLWSAGLESPWKADYHLNINIQMNYWPAESTGLLELHQPLLDLAGMLPETGKGMADALGYNGFCTGHAINPWPSTWFSGGNPCWAANLVSGAWVVEHLMEHYRFSADHEFLEKKAWPVMRENAAFLLGWLQKDSKTGKWITGPGSSPENTFLYTDSNGTPRKASISCGTSHGLMITWESLSDLIEAARILGREDDPVVQQAKTVLPHLAEARIGSDGRLQEWYEPFEGKNPGHRHMSHGYGFFPGHQYNFIENPEQVEALKKSLDYRLAHGGGHTGWSRAWLISLQATLLRPEKAYENLRGLIVGHINPNLFDLISHPGTKSPFQIEANFGYAAGVATMLLQSRIQLASGERVIQILFALPKAWRTGSIQGLRTRGGLCVDIEWTPATVKATLHAERVGQFRIQCFDEEKILKTTPGKRIELTFSNPQK